MMMTRFFLFFLLFLLFVLVPNIIIIITDWWWFNEVGYAEVFTKPFIIRSILGTTAGVFAFIFLSFNFWFASRSVIPWLVLLPKEFLGKYVTLTGNVVKRISILGSLLMALFIGLIMSSFWQEALLFLNQHAFNKIDPVFKKDIAFYIFTLPFINIILQLLWFLLVIALIGCGIIYILRGNFGLLNKLTKKLNKQEKTSEAPQTAARIHIGIILALLFLTIAAKTYLSIFDLLTKDNGAVFGAAYTDIALYIPLYTALAVLFCVTAFFALIYSISNKLTPLLGSAGLAGVLGLILTFVPPLYHQFIVAPNELDKEKPFIKNNIDATTQAFGLTSVTEKQLSGDKPLTAEDIKANDLTIKNVRLWDQAPLLSTFSQLQEIRTYYEFNSIDNDRYLIDGKLRQIMLSPRELLSANLPNKNWINERLTFTHGYGVAAGPVNQVSDEGLPVLFVKDLPPKEEKKELKITRPEIYYGELSNDHIFVKTKQKEFDYPKGDENVSTIYQGEGGVPIDSLIKRVAYALRFNSLKPLFSEDITNESRVMYYRTIAERMQKTGPFLTFDKDPYSVIADGKLYWIGDAYTKSNAYPYSKPLNLYDEQVNYIRNSVKVVIDAYNGTTTYYIADSKDPIINTYAEIFPGMFKPLSEMPKSILSHIRYPEDIFTLQTTAYSTYHMKAPEVFYNKEDQWDIPAIAVEGEANTGTGDIPPMAPRHMIMRLPGQSTEEYILMLPFIPRGKDNMAAWMVARNDGEQYGKISVYQFPKQKLIYGPKQIIARINQDADISRQISLWDQKGSQVIQGPLLVIPIQESLLYVRPLYLKAESGKIPELKRVIVAYENKIAMETTLEQGLAKIFGSEASVPEASTEAKPSTTGSKESTSANSDQIIQATQSYDAAMQALRDGDWTKFGEEMQKVGETLKK